MESLGVVFYFKSIVFTSVNTVIYQKVWFCFIYPKDILPEELCLSTCILAIAGSFLLMSVFQKFRSTTCCCILSWRSTKICYEFPSFFNIYIMFLFNLGVNFLPVAMSREVVSWILSFLIILVTRKMKLFGDCFVAFTFTMPGY